MAVRLKIGSYIIDAALSGSTSTTTGCVLLQGDSLDGGQPGIRYQVSRDTATLVVPVLVDRNSTANMKTSLDALEAAVLANVNADIVYESATGTTLRDWKVSDGTFSRIEGTVSADVQEENALVLITFNMTRLGVEAGGSADPDNAITPVLWNFSLDVSGLASCAGDCTFKTREGAAAWVQTMRSGTGWPGWLDADAFRFSTAIYQKEQQLNQTATSASVAPEQAFTPAAVTVILVRLPAAFASNSAFDNVVSLEYDAAGSPRGPIDENAGIAPGYDVILSGTLQFKTEKDTTYDSNDSTSVASADLKSTATACINAIEAEAKTRLGLEWVRVDEPTLTPTGGGSFAFAIVAMTGSSGRVTEWTESMQIIVTPRDRAITGSKGVRVHPHRLGPEIRVQHSLAITAFSKQVYVPPTFISSSWFHESPNPTKPRVFTPEGGGRTRYVQAWSHTWYYLGDSNAARNKYEFDEIIGGLA